MKNLGTLYGYEVKKLLKWKPAWVVTVVLTVLMIYTAWPKSNGSGAIFSLTDPDGNTVSQFLTGSEQNEQTREGARRISGQAMDETFFQNLRAASTGNGHYVLREHWDQVCYFYLIDNSYLGPYSLLTEEMGLDPATATAEQFYQARQEKIDMQLVGLTDEERGYWRDMENRVEKPFVYQYSEGYQEFLNNVYGLSNVIPLLAGVCLCALFSEEKRTRSDSLIFTSRRSRLPQYLAKVLAGMTVAVAAALLVIGVTAAVVLLNWGWDGFDAAIQLWYLISGVPLTMGQGALVMAGLLLLYAMVSGGVAMLLSALTKNTVAALAGPVLLMIGQAWLRVDAQAAEYLPNQLFNVDPSFRNFNLIHIFGTDLNNLEFAFVLYGVLAVCLVAVCWPCWRRWAVAGK